ncbi:MAG: hypothetical protein WA208_21580 [Thermoanaerobaculia bacterium]
MKSWCLLAVLLLISACNPFDPPLYTTPLPNGYAQKSNGGELGFLVSAGGQIVAPHILGPDAVPERWCNNFAWSGDLVVCEAVQYGVRAFVDPPTSIEYLLLNTRTGQVTLFKTRDELATSWRSQMHSPLPSLTKEHPGRREQKAH